MYGQPTAGLDPLATRIVGEALLAACARYMVTEVVVSSLELTSVLRSADRLAVAGGAR